MTRPAPLFALLAGLLGFAAAGFMAALFNDGDTWWHLAAGAWMLDHGHVLTQDVFSFSVAGRAWNAQEWLSEILMISAFRTAGWSGIHLLFGLAFGGSVAVMAWHVRRRTGGMPALVIILVGISCIMGSMLARPHVLALLPLALWTAELLRAREDRRAPGWWLLAVMLVWTNLHGSFAFGLALTCAFLLEAVLEDRRALRDWSLFLMASVVAAAMNPQFLQGLLFPFELLVMGSLHQIGEWAPTDVTKFAPFPITLFVLVWLGAMRHLTLSWLRTLILLGLVFLALSHARHQIIFGLVAPMLMASGLNFARDQKPLPSWLMPAGLALMVAMLAARLWIPTTRHDDKVSPMTALAHVPASLRAQPVLNQYGMGGYLIWSGVKVFIDGRTDLYGDAFMTDYDLISRPDRKALEGTLAKYHIAWAINAPGALTDMLDTMPGWHRGYSDDIAVVHVKN